MKSRAILLLLCLVLAPSVAAEDEGEGGDGSGEEPSGHIPAIALVAYRTAEWLYIGSITQAEIVYKDATGEQCMPIELVGLNPRAYLGNPFLGVVWLRPECGPNVP